MKNQNETAKNETAKNAVKPQSKCDIIAALLTSGKANADTLTIQIRRLKEIKNLYNAELRANIKYNEKHADAPLRTAPLKTAVEKLEKLIIRFEGQLKSITRQHKTDILVNSALQSALNADGCELDISAI